MKREEIGMGNLIMAQSKLYIVDSREWDESKCSTGYLICKTVDDNEYIEKIHRDDVQAVFANQLED